MKTRKPSTTKPPTLSDCTLREPRSEMTKLIVTILALVVTSAGCSSQPRADVRLDNEVTCSLITRHRSADLRAFFRSEPDIERLEKGRFCSIEAGGNISIRRSISVGGGLPLSKVIQLLPRRHPSVPSDAVICSAVDASIFVVHPSKTLCSPDEGMALTLDLILSCPVIYVLEDGARFRTALGGSEVAFLLG